MLPGRSRSHRRPAGRTTVLVAAGTAAVTLAFAPTAATAASATAAPVAGAPAAGAAGAGSARPSQDSGPAQHQDRSRPLRSYGGRPPAPAAPDRSRDVRDDRMPQRPGGTGPDPVVQGGGRQGTLAPSASAPAPAPLSGRDGVGAGFTGPAGTFTVNSAPPDTNSAVGASQVVETVNSAFAVFDKAAGSVTYGPVATNTLFSGFGGVCQTTNDGDAVVRYDRAAARWVITQFANAGSTAGPYAECVAVSTTSDATGTYNRYAFAFSSFPDYPKLGVWPDAYYMTYNLFNGNTFAGAESCAMDRAAMIAGRSATQQCFTTSSAYGGLLPADNDGGTPPPAGAPALHVALAATGSALAYWQFHVDFATPANSTFTATPGNLPVAAFSTACNGGTCIPQQGTTKLDSLADRLMYRLAYRNLGDHEAYVVTHSVAAASSTGVRWYELRPVTATNRTPQVFQQGTYAPDASYRWLGSAAMDGSGGIAMGYSVSSSTLNPSIRYAARAAADPVGTLGTEASLVAGGGSQTGTLTRWGDYASMSVDPVDDCTFWFSTEYLATSGTFNWHTRLGSFRLSTCGATPPPTPSDFTIAASPSGGTAVAGSAPPAATIRTTATGTPTTVNLAVTGAPAGVTATLSPTSVTAGGSSTLSINTASGTAPGTYPLTITGTSASATHSTTYTLTVTGPPPAGGITNGGFESGLTGWTSSGPKTGTTTTSPHTGASSALLGASTPTNGASTISQTFTAPAGTSRLTLFSRITCPDTVTYDWATATLTDVASGAVTTVLARTCSTGAGWRQTAGASVTPGRSYTISLTSKDDNYTGDATYTQYDDVALG